MSIRAIVIFTDEEFARVQAYASAAKMPVGETIRQATLTVVDAAIERGRQAKADYVRERVLR